ncbi:Oxidoreductase, short chain dehydrogenase/reductase family [Cystobacter fuscus DSM 2262]|uniref:Oxidoreductase, short chain dehydrogenase/reductase family n=2 Tax=Cystobacter fuscus TaxID=43 RepID=S9PBB2_CYSF2|nr:Oxidoreductase, short chain dehydrogenase/reductase family [Cystobacter fuscus DSM 2262]
MTPGNMREKVCLITGATSGIGLESARGLAGQGATVVLAGRDPGRGEAALAEIRRTVPDAKLDLMLADLTSLASVRKLAEDFQRKYSRLDVLLNNAGLIIDRRKVTADGFEATFATNHLAHFLLTHQLLELLEASGTSRVVNVSSEGHRMGSLDFLDDLQAERGGYSGMKVYGNSKLANILFTRGLKRRLEGTKVTTNSLHPGVVRTGFALNSEGILKHLIKLAAPFMLSAEGGARTSVYLASSPEVEGVSGRYFIKSRVAKESRAAQDDDAAEELWRKSAELTGVGR